jgi:hypothetical protein
MHPMEQFRRILVGGGGGGGGVFWFGVGGWGVEAWAIHTIRGDAHGRGQIRRTTKTEAGEIRRWDRRKAEHKRGRLPL